MRRAPLFHRLNAFKQTMNTAANPPLKEVGPSEDSSSVFVCFLFCFFVFVYIFLNKLSRVGKLWMFLNSSLFLSKYAANFVLILIVGLLSSNLMNYLV